MSTSAVSNQPLLVYAFDPGVTTGYAQGLITDGLMKVVTGQDKLSHSDLWLQLRLMKPGWIVTESFEFRRKAREGLVLTSVELIGVLHLYCQLNEVPLKLQTATQGKGHFTDGMLSKAGLYKGTKPHANDACRHLLQWFVYGQGYQFNTRGFESAS